VPSPGLANQDMPKTGKGIGSTRLGARGSGMAEKQGTVGETLTVGVTVTLDSRMKTTP